MQSKLNHLVYADKSNISAYLQIQKPLSKSGYQANKCMFLIDLKYRPITFFRYKIVFLCAKNCSDVLT